MFHHKEKTRDIWWGYWNELTSVLFYVRTDTIACVTSSLIFGRCRFLIDAPFTSTSQLSDLFRVQNTQRETALPRKFTLTRTRTRTILGMTHEFYELPNGYNLINSKCFSFLPICDLCVCVCRSANVTIHVLLFILQKNWWNRLRAAFNAIIHVA